MGMINCLYVLISNRIQHLDVLRKIVLPSVDHFFDNFIFVFSSALHSEIVRRLHNTGRGENKCYKRIICMTDVMTGLVSLVKEDKRECATGLHYKCNPFNTEHREKTTIKFSILRVVMLWSGQC